MFRIPQFLALSALAALLAPASMLAAQAPAPSSSSQPPAAAQDAGKENSEAPSADSGISRGKKLILKDGSFQLIREYQRNGDRVRYFSTERGQWEEIPASLVDWDATAKAAAVTEKRDQALLAKVHHQQAEEQTSLPLDVDASLLITPKIFLPSGEGMFVLDGKTVTLLDQVASREKTDKKRFLERVLLPVPVIPNKSNIEIPGAHAKIRIHSGHPEFYLREAPPDPDRRSPIMRSSRPGESGPEVELIRADVKGDNRRLESISSFQGEQLSQNADIISIQSWHIAPRVYRYTLSQPLPPGEYVLAEILPDGMNVYVWDFGVDERPQVKP